MSVEALFPRETTMIPAARTRVAVAEAAASCGVSEAELMAPGRAANRRLVAARKVLARKLRAMGRSLTQIAAIWGLNRETARRYLRDTPERRATLVERACRECGRRFELWPSHAADGRGIYCSEKCRQTFDARLMEASCQVCGIRFMRSAGMVLAGRVKYCTERCQTKARRHAVVQNVPQ